MKPPCGTGLKSLLARPHRNPSLPRQRKAQWLHGAGYCAPWTDGLCVDLELAEVDKLRINTGHMAAYSCLRLRRAKR